jgi:hypothetical protein
LLRRETGRTVLGRVGNAYGTLKPTPPMALFTVIHVLISLVGILAGFVVVFGLIAGRRLDGWTGVFLATTVATSLTGFGFPTERLLPSHIVGIVSLVVLAATIFARYSRRLQGLWGTSYVVGAVLSLYLNFFVLVVQAFLKIPTLKTLAPTQAETPFKLTQAVVFTLFLALGSFAVVRFRRTFAAAAR